MRLSIFRGKKKPKETEESTVAKTTFKGGEVHVNPSEAASLKRLEARLRRVTQVLESGVIPEGSAKHEQFTRIKNKLEMLIKIKKGEV